MAVTVEITPVLSDKTREQIRAIVREEVARLTEKPWEVQDAVVDE